jgi:ankyrin repeat protein
MKSNSRFQTWLRGDANLLWIRGGPGKGKTMMSVYLTELIASEYSRSLAYYFCVSRDLERNNACAVLRGLLWQITQQHPKLTKYILPSFDPPARGQATISSEETLWDLLKAICRSAEAQRLYFLVDGLDECDDDSMHWLIGKFLGIRNENDYPNFSLIVLSRHITGLDDSICITLDPDHRGQVSADVAKFVKSKVEELSQKLGFDPVFEKNATRMLLEKSEGTFLWVGFVMAELLKKRTRSQVHMAMSGLPKGLPAVYARMLKCIEPEHRENSKRLFSCIALAFKPLHLGAIADIMDCQASATISEEQATLDEIAVCAPMLQLRGNVVEFVHQSATDYLLRDEADDDPILENFRITPEMSHLYLAQRCLQSLSENTSLRNYSYMNWPKHARQLHSLASNLLDQNTSFFQKDSPVRDSWWRRYSMYFPGLPRLVPNRLHMACFIGLEAWAEAILLEEQGSGKSLEEFVNEKCPDGWLALNYAAESASGHTMKLLLECTPDGGHAAEQLDCSLRQAVLSQREEAAKLLLDRGADPNKSDVDGKSPLFHAISLLPDHRGTAIVRLLNDHGVDPGSMTVEQLDYKLRQAVLLQREEVVKLLLGWGADPNKGDVDGKSPFFHAMFRVTDPRSTAIVHLLRDHGADPGSIASRESDRSLWSADAPRVAQQTAAGVQYQCSDTIQILLDYGIDINICNGEGETILHIVVKERMVDSQKAYLVRFLCGVGAGVDARTHSGETALHIAMGPAWFGYDRLCLETVRALCECGAGFAD